MMRIVRTVIMAGAVLGLMAASSATVEAEQRTSKHRAAHKPGKSPETAATNRDAESSLDKARRALAEGNADTALQLANAVLISENKDTRSTARALAIRGEAYLHQGRPAEAIADLESALWLKGGLEGKEREVATNARSQAMQKSGIANAAPVIKAPLPTPAAEPVAPRPAAPPPPARAATLSSPSPVSPPPVWNNAVTVAPAPPSAAAAPAERPAATFKTTATRIETAAAAPSAAGGRGWSTAREPASPPTHQDATESKPASGGGLAGFFSNLFGGGKAASASADASPTTTATVTPSPAPRTPAVSSSAPQRIAPEPRASHASAPRAAPLRATAMVAPANPAPAATPSNDGTYKLQLAAVRTKAEAQEMAEKVREEAATLVGSRTFEIVEDVYGNMGRFYRVRIGSYSEPAQALSACASLRDRRMDCMVIDH